MKQWFVLVTHTKLFDFYSNFIYHNHFSTKKAITTFGYNPYIEDNIGIQSGNYYPSPNAVIEEKSVRNRQKWNKNDAGMTSIYEIFLLNLHHKPKEFVAWLS